MHGRMGVLRRCAQMSLHLVFCLDDSSWFGCSDLRFARLVRAALVPASLLYSETSVGRVMMLLLTSDHPRIMLLRTIPPHCNCCKHYQYQYHSMWPLMGCCGAFLLLHCSEKQDTDRTYYECTPHMKSRAVNRIHSVTLLKPVLFICRP